MAGLSASNLISTDGGTLDKAGPADQGGGVGSGEWVKSARSARKDSRTVVERCEVALPPVERLSALRWSE